MNKITMKDIIKIRREATDKCTTILQSFEYQKINIETSVSQYGNIKEVKAYFWNNKHGYSIEISSESCMVCDVEEIINFVSNPIDMSEININTSFIKYLTDNDFKNVIAASWSNKDLVVLSAFKDENKYIIHIRRQIACAKIEENNDELQVFDANEIAAYKQKLNNILNKIIKINSYEIEVSPDLQNICISVSGDLVKYFLNILCYENLNWWCDEDVIYEIISSWYESGHNENRFIQHLNGNRFKVVRGEQDPDVIFAYIEGHTFELKLYSKNVVDFDNMDGHKFEQFCADILKKNDYEKVRVTPGSKDQGIDIIAYKEGIKYGIQCKCYSSDIGNAAVQEAFAGKTYYDCHVGVVLTNRFFTKSARELADHNKILLWDRYKLLQMVKFAHEQ